MRYAGVPVSIAKRILPSTIQVIQGRSEDDIQQQLICAECPICGKQKLEQLMGSCESVTDAAIDFQEFISKCQTACNYNKKSGNK